MQWQPAVAALRRWVELAPNSAEARESLGWAMERVFQEDDAEKCYLRAIELDPTRERARLWLAELYLTRYKVEEARPLIEQLLSEQPDKTSIISAAGQLRALQGRFEEAAQLFDRAIAKDPKDAELLLHRAKMELQTGRPAEAERWVRRALALDERRSWSHFLLHQAISAQPGRERDADAQLAVYKKYQQQEERFSRLIRELIPAHPNDPKYLAEFDELLFQYAQPDKAVYWHTRALQIDPGYAPSLRALAEYYESAGHPNEAARYRSQLAPPPKR
jgi:predicted Zn-dependent protease